MSTRRRFLQSSAAGTALLSMPPFLAACAPKAAPEALAVAPVPQDPFAAWFGIDDPMLSRLLAELSSQGADIADLYFQHSRSTSITLEDGIVSRASTSIDQGVGLRVVVGDRTGYAFTEDLTEEAMGAAARTARGIASTSAPTQPAGFTYGGGHDLYTLAVPWQSVGVDQKLPVLRSLEQKARALDPAVDKVSIWWTDGEERVLVVGLDGRVHTDLRPQSRLWCSVTATRDGQTYTNSANLAGRRGFDFYTDEQLDALAKRAVDRTMLLFDARRPPAGELPVVLAAGASGILLH